MQISKATHLKHLLRTQDVFVSALIYLVAVNLVWFAGSAGLSDVLNHILLLPFIILFSFLASFSVTPELHGKSILLVAYLAARYSALIVVGVLAIAYIGKFEFVSRYVLALFAVLLTTFLLGNRIFIRWWYFKGRKEHPDNFLQVLVIGSGKRANELIQTYKENSSWGIRILGMLDPGEGRAETPENQAPLLGHISRIRELLTENVIDEVIICLPRSLLGEAQNVVDVCAEEGVCIKFLADLYEVEGGEFGLEHIGTWPVLSLNPVTRGENALIVKRIFDLLVIIPSIILLLPLFLLTALAIKLESRGTVFFRQTRIGLNKRKFKMIKFRSMHVDAEEKLKDIEHLNEADGPIFKMENDPRVTRVGRFIRRSSIDELPQLINVLLGQMSLIGPRPMSARDVSLFSKGTQRKRFSVRPGLACLREVSGRSLLSFEQWLALDLKYIDEWTFWLDMKILLLLLPAVIKGDGAA